MGTSALPNNRKHLTNVEIYNFYRYGKCRCGAKKWEREAFCYGCFQEIPPEIKRGLTRKFGKGFESAFRFACRAIDGESEADIYLDQ